MPGFSKCLLDFGIQPGDLDDLFVSSSWPLCQIVDGLGLPDCSIEACNNLVTDHEFDRLIIHTDGSSHSGRLHRSTAYIEACAIPDAWAFLVIGEKYQPNGKSRLTMLGWMAHQVRYDEINPFHLGATAANPLIAEREALTWAFIWRILLNSTIPTTFRTDSLTSKGQAEGTIGSANCDQSFQLLRGCYQLLESALGQQALQISHVFGHLGDPWNEFVDHVAKTEAVSSYYLMRPSIDLLKWKKLLPHLWLLFARHAGAPDFCGTGFHVPPPKLPVMPTPPEDPPPQASGALHIHFALSFASANVLSLGRPTQGHAGKTEDLRKQFADLNLNFLGLQETRADNGATHIDGILRLSSGHDRGTFGVELWCNLQCPIGYLAKKTIFLEKSHFNVAYQDARLARRILVSIASPHLTFWVLVAHAPQSGRPMQERLDWWQTTQSLLEETIKPEEPVFVCLDANAPPGACDGRRVFTKGFASASGTSLLRDFMDHFDLCAPATSHKHVGDTATWHSPDGLSGHVIDYVLVPSILFEAVAHSQLLEQFDLGNTVLDHTPIALELTWDKTISAARPPSTQKSLRFDRQSIASANLSSDPFHSMQFRIGPPVLMSISISCEIISSTA